MSETQPVPEAGTHSVPDILYRAARWAGAISSSLALAASGPISAEAAASTIKPPGTGSSAELVVKKQRLESGSRVVIHSVLEPGVDLTEQCDPLQSRCPANEEPHITVPPVFTPTPTISYNGGPILSDPVLYLVFAGPWEQNDPVVQGEETLLKEVTTPGSSYVADLNQYGVTGFQYGGVYFDPTAQLTGFQMSDNFAAQEAHVAAKAMNVTDVANAEFIVLPQYVPGEDWSLYTNSVCGDHNAITISGANSQTYYVAFVPPFQDTADFQYCTYDYSTNDGQVQTQSLVNADTSITVHEALVEVPTDPQANGSGWASVTTSTVNGVTFKHITELADPCYYDSGIPAGDSATYSYVYNVNSGVCELPDPLPPSPPVEPPAPVTAPGQPASSTTPTPTPPKAIVKPFKDHHKRHHLKHHGHKKGRHHHRTVAMFGGPGRGWGTIRGPLVYSK